MTFHRATRIQTPPRDSIEDRPRDPWVDGPDIKLAVRKIRARWRRIVAWMIFGTLLGLGASVVFLLLRPPAYTASAELIVGNTSLQSSGSDTTVVHVLVDGALIESQIELARATGVLERTVKRLGPDLVLTLAPPPTASWALIDAGLKRARALLVPDRAVAPSPSADQVAFEALDTLRTLTTAKRVGASQLITVSATSGTPKLAADAANALTQELLDEQREMTAIVSTSGALRDRIRSIGPGLRLVSAASPPARPSQRSAVLVLLLGAAAGGLLGFGLRAGLAAASRRVVTSEQIRGAIPAPFLGNVRRHRTIRRAWSGRGATMMASADRPLLAVRSLVDVLRLVRVAVLEQGARAPRRIGITSCDPRDGKSTTALALAQLLASGEERVLLVDAAWPGASLTERFAPESQGRLREALRSQSGFDAAVIRELWPNLDFLGGGQDGMLDALWSAGPPALANPAEHPYAWIIYDLPPLRPSVGVRAASIALDHLLIVVRWGRTRTVDLGRSAQALGPFQDRILGSILTMVPPSAIPAGDAEGRYGAHSARLDGGG